MPPKKSYSIFISTLLELPWYTGLGQQTARPIGVSYASTPPVTSNTKTHPPTEPISLENSYRMGTFLAEYHPPIRGLQGRKGRELVVLFLVYLFIVMNILVSHCLCFTGRLKLGKTRIDPFKTLGFIVDVQQSQCFGVTLNGQLFQMIGSDSNFDFFCGCF